VIIIDATKPFFRIKMKLIAVAIFFISFLLLLIPTSKTLAEVFVHDIIAVKNEETFLKVETRGKFSRKGGELVEFFVDNKSIGKALSGGDGFAFKQVSTSKTGTFKITVKSASSESSGLLLIFKKGTNIVFTDIEGGLLEGEFLKQKPRDRSQQAIRQISKKYPVVILQAGIISKKAAKDWIKRHGFIELPVIAWNNGELFQELIKKGLKIKAVIGGDAIIDSAAQYKPLLFSFRGKESALNVKSWDEIEKRLSK